ncbi:MAG: hypothetical protein FWD43_05085, partial [Coriobacteriia bacterium]|nr:hypothetical protein [Coriobacteriia bacterium]
ANTYVSCVIEDTSGAVLFYGKLSQAASGTVTFTVPAVADLPEGNYTIKIFSEEVNGDNFTDFCSASTSIPLIVDNAMPIHNIIYKNYDGADLVITDPTYPLTYTEGTGLVLPVSGPEGWMPGYDFLGFFDCQLDPNQKVPIPGTEYERLDFDIGTKILGISESATSDVTLYLRPYSDVVSMSINDNELYLFAAPGVFPNGTTADIRALEPGTQEYQDALKNIDITNLGNVKIAAFEVFDSLENKIQPISFFGDAVIGFMIPEGFSLDALSLIMVLPGADITLTSKIWTDPEDANLHYIEGTTEHFSLFALLDTSPLDNPQTSDMHSLAWLLVLSSMVLGALCIILSRRRERLEDL